MSRRTTQRPHAGIRRVKRAVIGLCMLAAVPAASDRAQAQGNGQQILFATNGVRITRLSIEGTNQRGDEVRWEATSLRPDGSTIVLTRDWWWKGTVVLDFDVVGQGGKQCVLDYVGGQASNVALVTYPEYVPQPSGPPLAVCGGDQGSARSFGATREQAWINALEPPSRSPAYQFYEKLDLTVSALDCLSALAVGLSSRPLACAGVGNELLEWVIDRADSPDRDVPPPGVITSLTVMVMDSSDSMNELDPQGGSKMQAAITAADRLLRMIERENVREATRHRVGAVDFDSSASVAAPPTESVEQVRQAIDGLGAGGSTDMAGGMSLAIEASRGETARRILVLLSDGVANDPGAVRSLLPEVAAAYDCVYAIGFGAPSGSANADSDWLESIIGDLLGIGPSYDEALLRDVAAATACGGFYTATDAFELTNVYISLRHQSLGDVRGAFTGSVAQGTTSEGMAFDVPSAAGELHVTLNWPGSTLDLELYDPAGRRVDATYPGATITTGPPPVYAIVTAPRSGTWSAAAYGRDVPGGMEPFGIVASTRGVVQTVQPAGDARWGLLIAGAAVFGAAGLMLLRGRDHAPTATKGRPDRRPTVGDPIRLLVHDSEHAVRTVDVRGGAIRIGRSPDNELVLRDATVSRHHCRLAPAPSDGWVVEDCSSSSGTLVNGRRIVRDGVKPGDVVALGASRIEIIQPEPVDGPAPDRSPVDRR